jgi:L-ascorbate metabolism protein UlaG (beta-lactamase superfamily)
MATRRRFLTTLGAAVVGGSIASAQERLHRSRWDLMFNSGEILPAPASPDPRSWDDATITAAWIGHSTILINYYGMRILTDPVLSDRIGLNVAGLFTIGPKRLVAPALTFDQLPPIDLLLLSHAHMDHLDIPTLDLFPKTTPVIMAKNTADVIDRLDFETVYELDWDQWTEVKGLRIEALQVKHFGWRYPWEKDRSRGFKEGRSYNAYLLSRNGHHIVFGGDTSYHEMFKTVGQRNLTIDLAMMPIGAYDPWIYNHANPEQALAMAGHMNARAVLPMHWRTFIQSDEPTMEPIQRFTKTAPPSLVALETIGQTWTLADSRKTEGQPRAPIEKELH